MDPVCPCIDCITLGMCKGAVNPNLSISIDVVLSERCSIFKEFYKDKNIFIDIEEWRVLLDLFSAKHQMRTHGKRR